MVDARALPADVPLAAAIARAARRGGLEPLPAPPARRLDEFGPPHATARRIRPRQPPALAAQLPRHSRRLAGKARAAQAGTGADAPKDDRRRLTGTNRPQSTSRNTSCTSTGSRSVRSSGGWAAHASEVGPANEGGAHADEIQPVSTDPEHKRIEIGATTVDTEIVGIVVGGDRQGATGNGLT